MDLSNCDHQASHRGNIIRHLKLVHSVDDRDSKNAYRETSKALNGKVQTSMDSNEFEQQISEVSHGQQSIMSGSGIPLSEHITDLQDGRHSLRPQPRRREYDDSEKEQNSEDENRYKNLPDQELTEERIDEIYGDLKAKKRRIFDSVLKTIPDHLQTRAKRFCDAFEMQRPLVYPTQWMS